MIIAVASAGRADNVLTIIGPHWPKKWIDRTFLVVPKSEGDAYKKVWPNVLCHPDINRLSPTRDWINDIFNGQHVLHADDDSKFYTRNPSGAAIEQDMEEALEWFEEQMQQGIVYAGMGFRFMSQDKPDVSIYPPGISNFYAVNTSALKAMGFKFIQTTLLQGLNLAVTVATHGYESRMWYKVVYHQPKVNAPGGCSTYRTPEMYDETAKKFQEIHGEKYISIRRRTVNWEGMEGERDFVRVQWARIRKDTPQTRRYP